MLDWQPNSEVASVGWTTLRTELLDGVLLVELHRPEVMNAYTVEMADELEQLFRSANDDDAVRGIVVTGSGRAFCAGMDLRTPGNVFGLDEELRPGLDDMVPPYSPAVQAGVRDCGGRVTLAIHDCLKPVVAAINGAAVGIGATLTLAMDARIASPAARFGLVFGRIGVTPEACSTWFLPRIVGLPAAMRLLLSADILDAEASLRIGVVDEIVEADELVGAAVALVRSWVQDRSPVAVALTRQMLRRNSGLSSPERAHRIDSLAIFYQSIGDGKEGIAAFLEKRSPRFQSRIPQDLPPFVEDWLGPDRSLTG